jgi:hypothetical protein
VPGPEGNKFPELAVNGRADLIVSGDADPLVLDTFRGIPIITLAAFGMRRPPDRAASRVAETQSAMLLALALR